MNKSNRIGSMLFSLSSKKSNILKCFMFFSLGSKKRGILVKNLLGLIIAAAAVFILSTLLFKLIAPPIDPDKLTLESYMDRFRAAIDDADEVGVGEFSVLVLPDDNIPRKKYFLVYFGTRNLIDYLGKSETETLSYEGRAALASDTGEPVGDRIINYNLYYRFFLQEQILNGVCICSNAGYVSFNDCYGPIFDFDDNFVNGEEGNEVYDAYCEFGCKECISLEWPAVFENEPVVMLNSSDTFLIRKGKDGDEKTGYFFEEIDK